MFLPSVEGGGPQQRKRCTHVSFCNFSLSKNIEKKYTNAKHGRSEEHTRANKQTRELSHNLRTIYAQTLGMMSSCVLPLYTVGHDQQLRWTRWGVKWTKSMSRNWAENPFVYRGRLSLHAPSPGERNNRTVPSFLRRQSATSSDGASGCDVEILFPCRSPGLY